MKRATCELYHFELKFTALIYLYNADDYDD
jgi:hypothetical protein